MSSSSRPSRGGRRFPRIGPLVIRADVEYGGESHEHYVTSLSEGGAYLVSEAPFSVGERLPIWLILPWGLGTVYTVASVLYVVEESPKTAEGQPPGAGIAFEGLSPTDTERIRQYVSRFQALAEQFGSGS